MPSKLPEYQKRKVSRKTTAQQSGVREEQDRRRTGS